MKIESVASPAAVATGTVRPSVPPPAPAPAAPTSTPQTAAAAAAASLISSTYSVTVAGISYSGAISQSNGQYTIAVANLPGATVTAPSLPAAELALTVRIDTLA